MLRMISLVKQTDLCGCGVACLAMILGIEYADAKRRLFGKHAPSDPSVTLRQIRREVRRAGIASRYDWQKRGFPCVVTLTWPKHFLPGDGHVVVWDPDQPTVYLDPWDGPIPVNTPLYRVARQIAARNDEPILVVKK